MSPLRLLFVSVALLFCIAAANADPGKWVWSGRGCPAMSSPNAAIQCDCKAWTNGGTCSGGTIHINPLDRDAAIAVYTYSYSQKGQSLTSMGSVGGARTANDSPEPECTPTSENPVKLHRGEKYYHFADMQSSGSFPLTWDRHYRVDVRKHSSVLNIASGQWYWPLLDMRVVNAKPGITQANISLDDGSGTLTFKLTSGVWAVFNPNGSDNTPTGVTGTFSEIGSGWKLVRSNNTAYEFDSFGFVTKVTRGDGLSHTIGYTFTGTRTITSLPTVVHMVDDATGNTLDITLSLTQQPLTVTDNNGNLTQYQWDAFGRLQAVIYPDTDSTEGNNPTQVFEYNSAMQNGFESLITGFFETTKAEFDASIAATPVALPESERYSKVAYDTLGRVSSSALWNGSALTEQQTFSYNWDWNSTTTSPITTMTTTDGMHSLSSAYTFSAVGGVSGGTRTWKLVAVNNQEVAGSVSGCAATSAQSAYDANGFLTKTTDKTGNIITVRENDALGHITSTTTGLTNYASPAPVNNVSQRTQTTWSAQSNGAVMPTERRYYGYTAGAWVRYRTVNFTYDNKNNLYSRMETDNLPNATAARTAYYANSYYSGTSVLQQKIVTDPLNHATTYNYNSSGQLTSMALPTESGVTQTFTYANYNSFGKPQTITDVANNVVTTLVYDTANGHLNSSTVAGATTDITYWPTNGLVRKVTSPDGSWLEYSYNSAHQLVRVDNQKSEYIIYTPSLLNGEWTDAQTYSASAAITAQQHRLFDALGRTWKQLDAASTPKVVYGYDQNDNLTNIIELGDGSNTPTYDNNSRVSYRTYDGQQRLSSETHCANTATTPPLICSGSPLLTSYTYDIQGNIATVTDANSHVTSYSYNGFGERVQQISPDTGTTQYEYSLAGNLITKTKALGTADAQVIAYEWDALNRLTLINYPGTTKDVTYTWDENSHGISKGRLTTVADASGVTGYSYNGHGLVTSKQQTPTGSGHTFTMQYSYAANDTQLDTETLPSGEQIHYNRSGADISSITNLTSTTNGSANILTDILYRPFGNATGWQTNSGGYYQQERSYDQNGRLASRAIIDGNDGAVEETYEHDSYGDISAMRRTGHPEHDEVYEYSPLAQLTKVTAQYGRITYGYDNVGNRSSRLMERQDPATQAWQEFYTEAYGTNPNNNRLNNITRTRGGNPLRSRSFGYDARGNITSDARSKTENSTTTTDTLLLQYGESDRLNSIDVQ